jgi:enoyl-CoA hydratase/carnithine racemase
VSIRDGVLDALAAFEAGDVRAVIITGSGPAFCAGGDLKGMPQDEAGGFVFIRDVFAWFESVEHCPIPTIAAVNGAAMGGGAELAIACDLVVAADTARLGFPETQVGLMAPYAAARLPQLIPLAIAKEITLTGRVLSAHEAADHGLVNRVVAPEQVLAAAYELAELIALRSVAASRVTKQLQNASARVTAEQAARANADLFGNPDSQARIEAFIDKRPFIDERAPGPA